MTYIDVLSEAISHLSGIPKDFVIKNLYKFTEKHDKQGVLINSLLGLEVSAEEGEEIVNTLKDLDLYDTIMFFADSIKQYRRDLELQAMLN